MNIRLATYTDLPYIEHIYAQARQFMRTNGNAMQWNNGYPAREMTEDDIARGCLYVITGEDDIPHGVYYFAIEDDPTYQVIEDGEWLNDEPYGVIHRIASDNEMRGIFAAALHMALDKIGNIRIDTHDHNVVMQHVLEREGFVKCGTIYCHDSTPRIAYQLIEAEELD